MANDSSTGGYLVQDNSYAITDEDLVDALQESIVGITEIDSAYVRPRWQENPPATPGIDVDWVAVGVQEHSKEGDVEVVHRSVDGTGFDVLARIEDIEFLLSFYGPNAGRYATIYRDGIALEQNRLTLATNSGLRLKRVGETIVVNPIQTNNQWYMRRDLSIFVTRQVLRRYPVLDLVGATVTTTTDTITTTTTVKES